MHLRLACAAAACSLALALAGPALANPSEKVDLLGGAMTFVRLPKGKIGSGDDMPRDTEISRDVYLADTPVTRGHFAAFVAETKYATESEKGASGGFGWNGAKLEQKAGYSWRSPGFEQTDQHPVVLVTAKDASAYIAWARTKTGRPLRLPTEGEYAYAARAGATAPHSPSDALRLGFYKDQSPAAGTHPVQEKPANAWGLYDMGGNAYAWCSDIAPDGRQVLRGGSWMREVKAKSATRLESSSGTRNAEIGFRLAIDSDGARAAGRPPEGAGGRESAKAGTPPPRSSASDGPAIPGDPFADPSAASGASKNEMSAATKIGIGILCLLGLGGLIMIFARGKNGKRTNANVEIIKRDGFFVRANGIGRGTRLRYRCKVNGRRIAGELFPEIGVATFIYTGSRPTDIELKLGDDEESRQFFERESYDPPPMWSQSSSQGGFTDTSSSSYVETSGNTGFGASGSAAGGGGDFGGGGASASYDDEPLGNPRAY